MPAPRGLPAEAVELDFDIEREDWSVYSVENEQSLLYVRAILLRLVRIPRPGGEEYAANAHFVAYARAERAEFQGEPSNVTGETLRQRNRYRVDFNPIQEPWNSYRTREGDQSRTIRTRLVVTAVERYADTYDGFGEPLYNVTHQLVIGPPAPTGPAMP